MTGIRPTTIGRTAAVATMLGLITLGVEAAGQAEGQWAAHMRMGKSAPKRRSPAATGRIYMGKGPMPAARYTICRAYVHADGTLGRAFAILEGEDCAHSGMEIVGSATAYGAKRALQQWRGHQRKATS